MSFDAAIVETNNGGDLQLLNNDIAVVTGITNMPYLALFGGNKAQVTGPKITEVQSLDWWGNNLLMLSNPSIQFNSICEKALNTIPLTSSGRVLIENAIKKDLDFLNDMGATVQVTVTIVATDRINVNIKITQQEGSEKIIVVNFKKASDGDFFIADFNNDFLV